MNDQKIIVYYDGKCGLCSKEINHYKKISPENIFQREDITQDASELNALGISLAEGLKLLHAKGIDGSIHVGVDAFILIWKQLNRWKVLGFLVSLPLIRQIAQFAYKSFAAWRFNRLEHCKVAASNNE